MGHIDKGRPWDLFGRTRNVEILPPKTGEEISDWYKGTSDAVFQNFDFIEDFAPKLVLVASGDHIYNMDYRKLIAYHLKHKAELTVCLIDVPPDQAHYFGLAQLNNNEKIIDWQEKPARPKTNLASMGVYLFNADILAPILKETAKAGGVDFAQHVIPNFLKRKKSYGYVFDGYWRDVGTIDAYWRSNMDVLDPSTGLQLKQWPVKTNLFTKGMIGDRPPTYCNPNAQISNSLIARGCVIEGKVVNSLLSPGVRIGKNTEVIDTIIFHDTCIGQDSFIEKTIIDKSAHIDNMVTIGQGRSIENEKFPTHLFSGITLIGKKAKVGSNIKIGKNCIINPGAVIKQNCSSGETM
jgi:glucose-1-phosphate adenylyltransferase